MSFSILFSKVIDTGLCVRCGVCAGVCPVGVIQISDTSYPVLEGECIECGFCVKCCPGEEVDLSFLSRHVFHAKYNPESYQGHVENTFVAHATEEKIRSAGTSGGVVTALLLSMLRRKEIDGAIVVGSNSEHPYLMQGVLATNEEEILSAAQSKYRVTASMQALQAIRQRKGKFAVVALPCQVHGLRKLETVDPALSRKIYCIFGLYCHCNMEPEAVDDVLDVCNIDKNDVARFEFRGGGWPGGFHVQKKDGSEVALHQTLYTTILNVMFKLYGAKRCYLCIDALSEYADISFGDFWAHDYKGEFSKLERCTLLSQRTAKGLAIIEGAQADNTLAVVTLPEDRLSKRIHKMAVGKRNRNLARIEMLTKEGQAFPRYHMCSPALPGWARRHVVLMNTIFLFRESFLRKILLRFLFSNAAIGLEKINLLRKRLVGNYHGN